MPTNTTDPLDARIRRARAGVAAAERALRAARGTRPAHEVAMLERDLLNRRAYLDHLEAMARLARGRQAPERAQLESEHKQPEGAQ